MYKVKNINVFADLNSVEVQQSINQFLNFIDNASSIQSACLMPDCHLGYSVPIGAVFASKDIIFPSAVGYDCGCGVLAILTSFNKDEVIQNAKNIFNEIYKLVPVGFNHNKDEVKWDYYPLYKTEFVNTLLNKGALKQLGSLGGGNHFIEIGYDRNDKVWIVIHSGSRNFGHSIATYYMKLASGDNKAREGAYGFNINSELGQNYKYDLYFAQEFALKNRIEIATRVNTAIQKYINGTIDNNSIINRNHNHAEYNETTGLIIHRKGATQAELGMMGVIPGNMRDGSFIVRGKGNIDSLCSSSHGAGRVLGRKQVKEKLNIDKFKLEMHGITAKVQNSTLDESPMAYKNIFDVMTYQESLVEIVEYISPILNVKG